MPNYELYLTRKVSNIPLDQDCITSALEGVERSRPNAKYKYFIFGQCSLVLNLLKGDHEL